jgi:hypothetical protein
LAGIAKLEYLGNISLQLLANKAIKGVHDFTYLGCNVSEDGGSRKDVETRIQKTRRAFTRLRKIWPAHYVNRDFFLRTFPHY